MSPTNPLLKDDPMPQPGPHEPSMEEILASIRRIIAGDQALLASESELRGEAPRPDLNGEAFEPGSRAGAGRTFVSTATDGLVGAAFNALLASRFVQHSDVAGASRRWFGLANACPKRQSQPRNLAVGWMLGSE